MKAPKTLIKMGLFIALYFSINSCKYKAPLAAYPGLIDDKEIAIIPFHVDYRPVISGKRTFNPDSVKAIENAIALQGQKNFFQMNSDTSLFDVRIQNIQKSNQLLKESGIEYEKLKFESSRDLCRILDVDAVVRIYVKSEEFFTDGQVLGEFIIQSIAGLARNNSPNLEYRMKIHGRSGSLDYDYSNRAGASITNFDNTYHFEWLKKLDDVFPYRIRESKK